MRSQIPTQLSSLSHGWACMGTGRAWCLPLLLGFFLATSTGCPAQGWGGVAVVAAQEPLPAEVRPVLQEEQGARVSQVVDSLLAQWDRPDSPGAAVVVIQDGEPIHLAGYGMASLEHGVPNRAETVFDVASISKQFTAYAVALLEADGALSLDDPARRHIPELPEVAEQVTIRHLVHHTSGIRDWPGALFMAGWSFEDVLSFRHILRMTYQQSELNFDPGEEYAYSNTGYNLLAEVVSRVSGKGFGEFTRERIFEPLDMQDTRFLEDHGQVIPGRAESYAPDASHDLGYRRVTSNLTAYGSSSLFTTAQDLGRWMTHLQRPDFDRKEVVERLGEHGILNGGESIRYGWGQMVDVLAGWPIFRHGGAWAGYRSVLVHAPERQLGVAILGNTAVMDADGLGEEILRWLLEEGDSLGGGQEAGVGPVSAATGSGRADEPEPEPSWSPDAQELVEYGGRYRSPELDSRYTLRIQDGMLLAEHFRLGVQLLRPLRPDHFRAPGFGEVRFTRDREGRITGFTATQPRIRDLRFLREDGGGPER